MSEPKNQRRRTHHHRRRSSVFAIVAVLGLFAAMYSIWSASASKTAYSSTGGSSLGLDQRATASPNSPAPASSPAPVSSLAPASSASTTTGPSQQPVGPVALIPSSPAQVATWKAGPGGAALTSLTSQVGNVLMAHAVGQFVQMRRLCVSLASDVKASSTQSAIPDPAMQNLYNKALTSLSAGAAKCESAVSSHQEGEEYLITQTSSSLMTSAMSQLNTGVRELYIATWGIKTLKKS
jgi:hypothetical protein